MGLKFCVLPGQEPVRIAKTDGRVVIIGEELREIPADLHKDAYSLGAISEDRLNELKKRFTEPKPPVAGAPGSLDDADPPPDGPEARAEAIRLATVQILTTGNPADFTGKKPKVEVITGLVGFDITAAERDAAFLACSAGQE